ncbi:hypothetical protein ACFCYC_12025 [Streptomyces sp. NPDC056402]|uniref:hypothetical protein n=1 Tax=Streptomyces sp. NPDC056402 TaxID=3345810 RepID=UPI0035DDC900
MSHVGTAHGASTAMRRSRQRRRGRVRGPDRTSGTFTGFVMRCFDGLDRAPFMARAWPEPDARYEPFDM